FGVSCAQALDFVQYTQAAYDGYVLLWDASGAVFVYVSDRADAEVTRMRRLVQGDTDGRHQQHLDDIVRPYFALVDERGRVVRAAERLLPLEGASNFRDLGGYPAADGKTVRWGQLYRSGAMAKLSDGDYEYLSALGIRVLCDLRTPEERALQPTDWRAQPGARYFAVDYPAEILFGRLGTDTKPEAASARVRSLYADFPQMLKPQLAGMFQSLIAGEAPLSVNCSAGQDRTGLAAALILTALGTPREVIYRDYHLSTQWRRPDNERGDVDYAALASTNIVARTMLRYQERSGADGKPGTPKPLIDAQGEPLLAAAFTELETRHGSVLAYLDQQLGVDARALAQLRRLYTE
ncbi:MAG: tyrosine-protein phosphatase, partial [Panacagrimonas sp.]